ncbi:MAG: UDP-N-acetylmuramoyl-L-alanyl-D-glutamate--2,6-diaminopimelate ligase [Candidatus Microthrix sp.]|jgi:UDP-N-acetylmuramoyl-L-alanyl-D-glutamate--2,6-diaminopimelate ligase|nr:UDP-N-acetylmuramoyl-L-alanyl-D-glutamate--2,6-diaminopimelate ligase [Candidatus Microthrix sp.]MBK7165329.1 UDP-N-acetylmuramoyl-L-alanyl-D-glutamate--2,6-diaminopimelate ligase [Candidatus Microthrix sp.]MBP7595849.1 UDP-N-acetylmuramoyl-L-alanyl-D-glutamate--2,6-diaminopimelate ligase [Candidatus Microthrix sp.]
MAERPSAGRRPLPLLGLAELVGGRVVPGSTSPNDPPLHDVAFDSRAPMGPGTLFVAVRGDRSDGHDFVAAAVDAGAVAVMVERLIEGIAVPQMVVTDARAAMGPAAQAIFGHPGTELALVGVTGTNGKTTFVSLLAQLLDNLGERAESMGTLTGARTTPEGPEIARHLRAAVDDGVTAVAMEVSSHALALHRVDGLRFDVAVFTNLGRDHLDFHTTQEAYFAAKARLFEPDRAAAALVNIDDVHGRLLRDAAGALPVTGYTLDDLDDLELSPTGSGFGWRGHRVWVALPGRLNLSNVLAALEAAVLLGHEEILVAGAANGLVGPPGRFQVVPLDRDPTGSAAPAVVVDYAHSPDALSSVLDSARELLGPDGRLTVVYGCGGDRDLEKRPEMGRVAAERADRVIITSDNPRSEDPLAIMEQTAQGSMGVATSDTQLTAPELIVDRREAIKAALAEAGPGAMVVIAGKGHETTQTFADRVEDFDDVAVAAEVWAERGRTGGPR